MIAVIDYGLGNLFSLKSSLDYIGLDNILTSDKDVIRNADAIILPGVGAFRDAISKLKEDGLYELLIEQANSGKPFLGICLGMQLLFEKSYEYGEYEGLGLINGEIRSIKEDIDESLKNLKIPHMGWNSLHFAHNGNAGLRPAACNLWPWREHARVATDRAGPAPGARMP